jgi:hypothetical protein
MIPRNLFDPLASERLSVLLQWWRLVINRYIQMIGRRREEREVEESQEQVSVWVTVRVWMRRRVLKGKKGCDVALPSELFLFTNADSSRCE